ncbi:MAG: hypothetical protein J6B34_03075 [Clostridia bacterium]|nr:hypothetical protein [Clostridia bacterium]
MKRLVILFIFTLVLCSCTHDYYVVTGIDSKTELQIDEGATVYVVNTTTHTYHLPTCHLVKKINYDERWDTRNAEYLINHGYSPCGFCLSVNLKRAQSPLYFMVI